VTDDKTWLYRVNLDYTHNFNAFTDFVTNAFVGPTITFHPIEQFRFNLDAEYQNTIFVDNANGFPAVGIGPAPLSITRYVSQPEVTVTFPTARKESLPPTIGLSIYFQIGALPTASPTTITTIGSGKRLPTHLIRCLAL
jgi:hypothetical protein